MTSSEIQSNSRIVQIRKQNHPSPLSVTTLYIIGQGAYASFTSKTTQLFFSPKVLAAYLSPTLGATSPVPACFAKATPPSFSPGFPPDRSRTVSNFCTPTNLRVPSEDVVVYFHVSLIFMGEGEEELPPPSAFPFPPALPLLQGIFR